MDDSNYDEFGNYLGPDIPSSDEEVDHIYESGSEVSEAASQSEREERFERRPDEMAVDVPQNQVILHEDKKYYPDAEEVFGPDVETVVQEEDTQLLTEPLVAPTKERQYLIQEEGLPETNYDKEFMLDLMAHPADVRNIV
ncbi:hypothetical protein EV182_007651, partial [Spiromyces aspiralis]